MLGDLINSAYFIAWLWYNPNKGSLQKMVRVMHGTVRKGENLWTKES